MANKLKIIPELNLFVHYYSGTVFMSDYASLMYKTMRHPDYNKSMYGLADIRHTCMPMMEKQMDKFNKLAKNCPWIFGKIRGSVLISSTMQKKLVQIYKKEDDKFYNSIRHYADLESALDWLNIPAESRSGIELYIMSHSSHDEYQQ